MKLSEKIVQPLLQKWTSGNSVQKLNWYGLIFLLYICYIFCYILCYIICQGLLNMPVLPLAEKSNAFYSSKSLFISKLSSSLFGLVFLSLKPGVIYSIFWTAITLGWKEHNVIELKCCLQNDWIWNNLSVAPIFKLKRYANQFVLKTNI